MSPPSSEHPPGRAAADRRPVRRRRAVQAAVAAAGAAAALAACGGGTEVLAVVGFLGTGGGLFYVDAAPDRAGFTFARPCPAGSTACPSTLTISLDDGTDRIDTGLPDLFATRYAIRVQNAEGQLAACRGLKGTVDGRRVTIPGCFVGSYRSIQEIASDDGRTVLFAPFRPLATLRTGVWVHVADPTRQLRFAAPTGATTVPGCEITGATRRPFVANVNTIDFDATIAAVPDGTSVTITEVTRITSLAVSGGATWRGDFLGASVIELTDGTTRVTYERRNLPDPGGC